MDGDCYPFDPEDDWFEYSIEWTPSYVAWSREGWYVKYVELTNNSRVD